MKKRKTGARQELLTSSSLASQDGGGTWHEELTYSEKVKIHLARALIMNPEVMVLQRPLHHYDNAMAQKVLQAMALKRRAVESKSNSNRDAVKLSRFWRK